MVGSDEFRHEDSRDPYLGLVISGVFRLDALVGIGTTGRVYRATQLGFERPVAVKVIRRHLMQDTKVRSRFHREARLASRLTHPGIVRVLASGELEVQSPEVGGEAYLVSEYLEGVTLRQLLDQRRPMPLPEILLSVIAWADAVGEAHAHRIVHRDLKPENLMSFADDCGKARLVVLDFGLARALDSQQDSLTHDGAILGTPRYLSPEAARGEVATARSDVYSLATILYELLAERAPFEAESPMMVLLQKVETEPPPISESRSVPRPILERLQRELSKLPDERSPDARSFAVNLYGAAVRSGLHPSQLLVPQLSQKFLDQMVEVPA
jgi:eukaryotic-like serine/threonine-protein kinase